MSPKPHLRVQEHRGDLFTAPANSVLAHACNCQGSWGAGIAAQFARRYPHANQLQAAYCRGMKPAERGALVGGAILIHPMDDVTTKEEERKPEKEEEREVGGSQGHWIGCLFTSVGFGARKSAKRQILENTRGSVRHLLEQIGKERGEGAEVGEVWMNKINSGLFKVPWEETRAVLEGIQVEEGWPDTIHVMVE